MSKKEEVAAQSGKFALSHGDCKSQSVIITGAFTGLGRATALAFARRGAHLLISGRRDEKDGERFSQELRAAGAQGAEFVPVDVSHEDDVKRLVSRAVELYGHLDVAVNNAGTVGSLEKIEQLSEANYHNTFDTNVLGVIHGLKYEVPAMLKQGRGAIINVSSVSGHTGYPGRAMYVASKHAIEGLTKVAALEVAETGVHVNAVAPAIFESQIGHDFPGSDKNAKDLTEQMPHKRWGKPEEVAEAIVFLGTNPPLLNGQSIALDGGFLAQ